VYMAVVVGLDIDLAPVEHQDIVHQHNESVSKYDHPLKSVEGPYPEKVPIGVV